MPRATALANEEGQTALSTWLPKPNVELQPPVRVEGGACLVPVAQGGRCLFHCISLARLAHYAFMEHVNRPRRQDNGVPVRGQGANCGWVDKSPYDAERSLAVKATMP